MLDRRQDAGLQDLDPRPHLADVGEVRRHGLVERLAALVLLVAELHPELGDGEGAVLAQLALDGGGPRHRLGHRGRRAHCSRRGVRSSGERADAAPARGTAGHLGDRTSRRATHGARGAGGRLSDAAGATDDRRGQLVLDPAVDVVGIAAAAHRATDGGGSGSAGGRPAGDDVGGDGVGLRLGGVVRLPDHGSTRRARAAAVAVLADVGELVGEQVLAAGALRGVGAASEVDVGAEREGLGLHRPGDRVGLLVVVHPDVVQRGAEPLPEGLRDVGGQRRAATLATAEHRGDVVPGLRAAERVGAERAAGHRGGRAQHLRHGHCRRGLVGAGGRRRLVLDLAGLVVDGSTGFSTHRELHPSSPARDPPLRSG